MNKLLLGIFFLLIAITTFAQSDDNYNYTIGVKGYSLMQMPKILNQTNSEKYTHAYLNSILVKFNDNQISYRLKANYFRKNLSFFNSCSTCEVADGKSTDYSFTIGFEKNFNYAKLQPYFGGDFGFRVNDFTGEIKTVNPKSTNLPYNVDTDKNGFILAPLMGLKFSPIKEVSFFVETSLDFYYSYERQETVQQDAANTRSFAKYNKWEFLLNPLALGLQIHFSSKN